MLAAVTFYVVLFVLLVALPALLLLLFLFFVDHERRLWRRLAPAVSPMWKRLGATRAIRDVRTRHPRLTSFLVRRLDPHDPWGLPATIAGIAVVLGLWFFAGIVQDLIGKDPLVTLNVRLHNSIPLFRSTPMTWVMLAFTEIGNPLVLWVVCVGSALIALSRGKGRLAVVFITAIAGTSVLSVAVKGTIGQARPLDALIGAQGTSFPSGHMLSSAVVYGLFASLLLRARQRSVVRAFGTVLLVLLIVAIGLSRLYLGVHWPSDLLGSLALALVWLAFVLFFLFYERPLRIDDVRTPLSAAALRASGVVVLFGALVTAAWLVRLTTMVTPGPPPASRSIAAAALLTHLPADVPLRSEGLLGEQMEPISLILIGPREEIIATFERAGWTVADLPTPVRVVQEALAALANQPDANGPATPSYLADRPQTLTFEKPDAKTPGIRRRHHTRIWQTAYCAEPRCDTVWVATASFDIGVELSAKLHLPTHRIDPKVDAERALIASDLHGAGATELGTVHVVPPMRGTNAAGDAFVTDGQAVILAMPGA